MEVHILDRVQTEIDTSSSGQLRSISVVRRPKSKQRMTRVRLPPQSTNAHNIGGSYKLPGPKVL